MPNNLFGENGADEEEMQQVMLPVACQQRPGQVEIDRQGRQEVGHKQWRVATIKVGEIGQQRGVCVHEPTQPITASPGGQLQVDIGLGQQTTNLRTLEKVDQREADEDGGQHGKGVGEQQKAEPEKQEVEFDQCQFGARPPPALVWGEEVLPVAANQLVQEVVDVQQEQI